jgi:hypothetical protein
MSKRSSIGFVLSGGRHADTLIQRGYADAGEFLDGSGAQRAPIRMRMRRHGDTGQPSYGPVAVG